MLSKFPGPVPTAVLAVQRPGQTWILTLYRRNQGQCVCELPLLLFVVVHDGVKIPQV